MASYTLEYTNYSGHATVEPAVTGRAACKRCKQKIAKQELRVGTPTGYYEAMQWHHLDCWAQKGKTADASTLFGFQALEEAQKQEVRDCLEATAAPDSEDGDELAPKYQSMTILILKDVLRNNRQLVGGNKTELVARCVDGERHGALPPCPTCAKVLMPLGRAPPILKNAHRGGGFFCGGHWDEDTGYWGACATTNFASDQVQRLPWMGVELGATVAAPTHKPVKAKARAKGKGKGKGKKQWSSDDEEQEELTPPPVKKVKKVKKQWSSDEEEEVEEVEEEIEVEEELTPPPVKKKGKGKKKGKKEWSSDEESHHEEDDPAVALVSATVTLSRSTRVRKQPKRWDPS